MKKGYYRQALFLTHLSLEKILKAFIVKITGDHPPKLHNLIRLKELANLELNSEFEDVLGEFNFFNLHGRYPDFPQEPISETLAKSDIERAEKVFEWLSKIL